MEAVWMAKEKVLVKMVQIIKLQKTSSEKMQPSQEECASLKMPNASH